MSVLTVGVGHGSESRVGFCAACGIVREDLDGAPVTDCVCTAKLKHAPDCFYVKCVASPIDTGIYCAHGLHACEEHDCTCDRGLDR